MLEVRLLGEQRIVGNRRSGDRSSSARSIAPLGYLALHPWVPRPGNSSRGSSGPSRPSRRPGRIFAASSPPAPGARRRPRWDRAAGGDRGLLVVRGEGGVGKSRLLAELSELARAQAAAVANARCFGVSGRLPLAPVAEWLRSESVRSGLATLEPVWQAEVERLTPLVIDLSGMRSTTVDPAAHTVRVDGGCIWGTSTTPPWRSGWPRRPEPWPAPESAGSPSAGAWGT